MSNPISCYSTESIVAPGSHCHDNGGGGGGGGGAVVVV